MHGACSSKKGMKKWESSESEVIHCESWPMFVCFLSLLVIVCEENAMRDNTTYEKQKDKKHKVERHNTRLPRVKLWELSPRCEYFLSLVKCIVHSS